MGLFNLHFMYFLISAILLSGCAMISLTYTVSMNI